MWDKGIVEATFDAANTLFCQHVAGYTGSNAQLRGDRVNAEAAWTVPDLQDLLDEWLLVWQQRPHDAVRDPYFPRRAMSPNDKYAALVAAAGYLPVTLSGEDYLELLPVAWRAVNDYGIRLDYRTYDAPELGHGGASTPGTPPSEGSGRSTTTPTTCPRCSYVPRTAGLPRRGCTCR
jgi:putative transposase